MGLLTKKLGMTEFYTETGDRVPVTVLLAKGNVVLGHRTQERDGYTAVQVAFDDQKPSRMSKPKLGQFKKLEGCPPKRKIKEFRVPAELLAKFPIGSEVALDIFTAGQQVDVTGTSKGKGYQGVMKRHNMAGEKRTHGQHEVFRHGGSIGCRLTPGRVLKGKRMPGQMGNETVTIQNLEVAKVLADKGLILVRGPVPGGKNGYVQIRHAIKPAIRAKHG
ncbi:MAG TPA: 50S ribosomal protein L3 [Enhygromyxa sp.]|nr:50S ribosomal protein L3 [Enhygromyxa sp.]